MSFVLVSFFVQLIFIEKKNYKKFVTSLYNGCPKPVFHGWKKPLEKVLIKAKRRIFCNGVYRPRIFRRSVIWTPFCKCRWVISSWRLFNLVKYAVWRGTDRLGRSIYQLISLILARDCPFPG